MVKSYHINTYSFALKWGIMRQNKCFYKQNYFGLRFNWSIFNVYLFQKCDQESTIPNFKSLIYAAINSVLQMM